jgi:hypothetical protein
MLLTQNVFSSDAPAYVASLSGIPSFNIAQTIFIDDGADALFRSDSTVSKSEAQRSGALKAMRKSDLDDGRVEAKMPSVLYTVIER